VYRTVALQVAWDDALETVSVMERMVVDTTFAEVRTRAHAAEARRWGA